MNEDDDDPLAKGFNDLLAKLDAIERRESRFVLSAAVSELADARQQLHDLLETIR
jgi:hypothetical protein